MLIVGTAVNYAAKAGVSGAALNPTELDKGSVGLYGMQEGEYRDSLIISGATATGKVSAADFKGKTIKICEGLGGGKFKVSEFIDIAGIGKINTSAYAAPVAWKAYIGNNGTSGAIVVDTLNPVRNEVNIEIREMFSNRERGMTYRYTVLLAATGETTATILAKIKAAIDAGVEGVNPFTTVAINGGNTGLSFSALDNTKEYTIAIQGAIETSTITIEAATQGSGTYRLLRKFWEKLSQAKRGNFYSLDREYKEVPNSLVEGTAYDTYILGAVNAHVPGGYGGAGLAGNPTVGTSVEVQVVFPNGASAAGANQAEFEAIIKALTGATFTTLVGA